MNPDELSRIGKIVKTFGTKGEVIFSLENTKPEWLRKTESVFIRFGGNLVPFFISDSSPRPNNQAVVKFDDIDSVEEAAELSGGEILVPSAILPKKKVRGLEKNEVFDFKVIDQDKGLIGFVTGILDLSEQSLLQVTSDNKEILIPVTEVFITKIDKKSKSIYINVPEGLIDLNG